MTQTAMCPLASPATGSTSSLWKEAIAIYPGSKCLYSVLHSKPSSNAQILGVPGWIPASAALPRHACVRQGSQALRDSPHRGLRGAHHLCPSSWRGELQRRQLQREHRQWRTRSEPESAERWRRSKEASTGSTLRRCLAAGCSPGQACSPL